MGDEVRDGQDTWPSNHLHSIDPRGEGRSSVIVITGPPDLSWTVMPFFISVVFILKSPVSINVRGNIV